MRPNKPAPKAEFSFPALGNAIGYFLALYFIAELPWLTEEDESLAVAMAGTIMIHILQALRAGIVLMLDRKKASP